ncbi:DNA cytosine methyltransferase [Priestia megaterium]|uniref:DNA cytosine methyltransferase n=1 Tax=Priestia megaterium TaxID=1404 RepID=UPI002E1B511E|nr:DNA cytosine methyltransferase [Priestia megaterium]
MKLINSIKNNIIKKRKAKKSERGLYFQDIELMKTLFKVGTKYKYKVNLVNKEVFIVPSKTEGNTVSYRLIPQTKKQKEISKRTITVSKQRAFSNRHETLSQGLIPFLTREGKINKRRSKKLKPVIDIKDKKMLSVFSDAEELEVEIFEDKILVRGFVNDNLKEENGVKSKNTLASKVINAGKNALSKISKVVSLQEKLEQRKKYEVSLSRSKTMKVAAGQLSFDFDFADDYSSTSSVNSFSSNVKEAVENVGVALEVASLFSGAGVMDYGFVQEGFDVTLALEYDKHAVETYKHNLGDHIIKGDITEFDYKKFAENGAPIMIGGSPCQDFSNANRKSKIPFLDRPKNKLVNNFIDAVLANPNCKVFVLENVPKLLTSGFGEEICKRLSSFKDIVSGIVKVTDVGGAQDRERAIIIGSKIGKIDLPEKIVSPENYKTVRQAFEGLDDSVPNQKDYTKSGAEVAERMKHVPPGGNWRNIPHHLRTNKMLDQGSTHSSVYKRLEWDKSSITTTNARKSTITHPDENRIISVRESARLSGLPDSFVFKGTLSSMQQQIANAVPVELASSIARVIKKVIQQYNIRMGFAKPTLVTAQS